MQAKQLSILGVTGTTCENNEVRPPRNILNGESPRTASILMEKCESPAQFSCSRDVASNIRGLTVRTVQ